jgi:hypothetical protein
MDLRVELGRREVKEEAEHPVAQAQEKLDKATSQRRDTQANPTGIKSTIYAVQVTRQR